MVTSTFTKTRSVSPSQARSHRNLLFGARVSLSLLRSSLVFAFLGLSLALGGGASHAASAVAPKDSGAPPASEGIPNAPPIPVQPTSTPAPVDVTDNAATSATPAIPTDANVAEVTVKGGKVTIAATEADVVKLLRQVGYVTSRNVVIIGSINGTVTLALSDVTVERAVSLIAQAAGLTYRQDDDAFLIGVGASDSAGANSPASGTGAYSVYRCKHIQSVALVTTLNSTFDPQRFKAVAGPIYNSPSLEANSSSDSNGSSRSFQPLVSQTGDEQLRTLDVILSGDPTLVAAALKLCEQLDRHRKQVRLKVSISDVSYDASRQLGLQYNYGGITFSERGAASSDGTTTDVPRANSTLSISRIDRTPIQFSATLSALESRGQAKTLAQPTLSVLDGERTFILIGQRLLFPVLASQSTIYGPQYTTQEVQVGVYIQVVARIGEDNDVTLAIYPQVSSISGYLELAGTRYPQIVTREQQTTVRARNGETFAIGGLISEDEVRNMERIPLLSRIPLLGELFKFRSKTRNRSELVLAITPEVISDDSP